VQGITGKVSSSAGTPEAPENGALAVSVKKATQLLDLSERAIYRLIETGELQSYHSGRSRKVTFQSIRDYIERQLKAEQAQPSAGRRGQ